MALSFMKPDSIEVTVTTYIILEHLLPLARVPPLRYVLDNILQYYAPTIKLHVHHTIELHILHAKKYNFALQMTCCCSSQHAFLISQN